MIKRTVFLKAELLGRGQAIIIEELSKITSFKQSLQELVESFHGMADLEEIELPLDLMILSEKLENKPNVISRVKEYVDALSQLADIYQLNCDWIIDGLHQIVRNLVNPDIKTPISNMYMNFIIDRFQLDIPIFTDTRKEDVQRTVDAEWTKLKLRHSELRVKKRKPDEFDRNVRWLCQRLFFGKTGRNIYVGLATNEDISSDYINLMIYKTAKLLNIKLPRGRPPNPNDISKS